MELFGVTISAWLWVSAIVFVALLFSLIVKRFLVGRIAKALGRTQFKLDSLFIAAISGPLTIIVLLLHLLLFERLLVAYELDMAGMDEATPMLVQLLLIGALVTFADRFLVGLIRTYANNSEALRTSQGIIAGLVRGLVLGIGLLIALGTLGIAITPIIASLGITSLAVALALQPTLSNFFSGMQLVIDKPIRVGDYIELDSGEQGFVEKIGWRTTWIKMLPNNTVIMPNSLLSESKIINYFYPEKELSVPVEVGVHYDSDLEHVEQVTLEVARQVLAEHEWGVAEYNTFVVFHTFDSSSINFTVMLRVKEYFNRFFVKSAFIKALHKRYRDEGIVIPYPIRAINTSQETPVALTVESRG